MIALLKLFGIVRALSRYGERYFSHRATFTILSNIRVSFFDKLEPLAPNIFQKYRSGDLLARIVGDVESLQNFFLTCLLSAHCTCYRLFKYDCFHFVLFDLRGSRFTSWANSHRVYRACIFRIYTT